MCYNELHLEGVANIMDRKLRFSFRVGDLIAISLVLVLAAVIFASYFVVSKPVEKAKVQIYHNNELIKEFALNSTERIEYIIDDEYYNKIVIEDGEVYFSEGNCPGTDCVHSGKISKPGRSLVCLPNKVEIRITGDSDVDIELS